MIELARFLLLGEGEVRVGEYAISVLVALGLLLAGIVLFQKTERTFIDTV